MEVNINIVLSPSVLFFAVSIDCYHRSLIPGVKFAQFSLWTFEFDKAIRRVHGLVTHERVLLIRQHSMNYPTFHHHDKINLNEFSWAILLEAQYAQSVVKASRRVHDPNPGLIPIDRHFFISLPFSFSLLFYLFCLLYDFMYLLSNKFWVREMHVNPNISHLQRAIW